MIKRIVKWIREFFANYIWFQKKLREKFSLGQCILLNFRFLWCVVTDGCSPEEYLWFEFYHKNRQERKTFLTYLRHAKLQRRYNSKRVRNILNDKQKFNEFFNKELGREWLDADSADTDEIEQFLKKHQIVIVKPKFGRGGVEVHKYYYQGEKPDETIFSGCLLEECIQQHKLLQEFNPNVVNTLRIGTFCINGKAEVFAAGLRMGISEGCVDNLCAGGICANVQICHGIVNSSGIDGDFNRFKANPYSGKKLQGFRVPYWNEAKELAVNSAQQLSDRNIVGWDVAITKDGPVLLEGNPDQGTGVIQMCDTVGKYPGIQRRIKESRSV